MRKDYRWIYRQELPHRAVALYIYLLDRANDRGECWPFVATISKELHMSQSTVRRAIKDLKNADILATERRFRIDGSETSMIFHLKK